MKEVKFKVNEQFDSVQGEGLLVGQPATFIRLQGCSVGCPWCDSGPLADEIEGKRRTNGETANTWGPGGYWATPDEITKLIHRKHVIITGGEPTIWDLDPIIKWCQEFNVTTQLETSGQNALKGKLQPDWVTWSPKERLGFGAPMSIKDITKEVKFVVDEYLKVQDIQKIVDYYYYENNGGLLRGFVLMPEGCPPNAESIYRTMNFLEGGEINWHGFQARLGARLQYYLNMR